MTDHEGQVLDGMSISSFSPIGSGHMLEEGMESMQEPASREQYCEGLLHAWTHNSDGYPHMTWKDEASQNSSTEEDVCGPEGLSLTEQLLAVDGC